MLLAFRKFIFVAFFDMDDLFEWNSEKSRTNLKNHGVSFEEAETVFSDRDDKIRIISARLATPGERRKYEQETK